MKRRPPRQQKPRAHVSVRLDETTMARGEVIRQRLLNEWRDATASEAYRMLACVGIAAVDALEREGRSLKDTTLVRPQQELRAGKHSVPVRVDEPTRIRLEETRAKLSSEWRQATLSDVIRLFLLLGLEHVEGVQGKNLRKKLPNLLASLRARGRAERSST